MGGGRHLDTAMLYSNHREVGTGVRQAMELGIPRSEIFLVSKIWPDDFGFDTPTEWIERMLEELGLDYVDLVLLHSAKVDQAEQRPCATPTACRQETWMALQRARAQER